MSDLYKSIAGSGLGGKMIKLLNLPAPVELERWSAGSESYFTGDLLVGAAPGGALLPAIATELADSAASVRFPVEGGNRDAMEQALATAGLSAQAFISGDSGQRFKGLVFDASGVQDSSELESMYRFFHPVVRKMQSSGRVVVLGRTPAQCEEPGQAIAMRALEGFVRALAKEVKQGCAVQLIYVDVGAEEQLAAPLRFCLSAKSAYVSGQRIQVGAAALSESFDWREPLAGKVALVTGAAQGIGASIAATLARDGAKVVGLDIPAAQTDLDAVCQSVNGASLVADITASDAPQSIAKYLQSEFGGVDIVVHNAGVTRDKTLGGMPAQLWNIVMDINLAAVERINTALLGADLVRKGGRIICVSSMSGIAGNFGQTNYATSKAGVIGMVDAMAVPLAKRGITINAVAPGFIETRMTAAMPVMIREVGRRLNSMSQGGEPVDVAEAIAFFASPGAAGVSGNTLRVCGQNWLGA